MNMTMNMKYQEPGRQLANVQQGTSIRPGIVPYLRQTYTRPILL
jgi:hypothetical protein